jgi:hypothetical protein
MYSLMDKEGCQNILLDDIIDNRSREKVIAKEGAVIVMHNGVKQR